MVATTGLGQCIAQMVAAEAFNRAGFPVAIDPPVVRSSRARLLPVAAGLAVGVLVIGGGVALAAHEMHHSAGPATPVHTSAVPSTHAGPTVTKAGSAHARHRAKARAGNPGAVVVPAYSPVPATPSAHATTPRAHPTSAKPTKSKHTTPPTSTAPTTPATTTSPTTPPPTTPPPTSAAFTSGASTTGVLDSLIHLLAGL